MPLEQVIGTRSSTAKTEIKTNRFGVSEGGERESDGRGETAHTVRQRARRKRSRNARAVRRRILSQIQELLRQSAEVVGKRSMGAGRRGFCQTGCVCATRVVALWRVACAPQRETRRSPERKHARHPPPRKRPPLSPPHRPLHTPPLSPEVVTFSMPLNDVGIF